VQGAFLHPARSAAERRCTRRKAPLHPTQYSGSSYVRPVFPVSLPLNVHGTCIHVAPSTLVVNNFPQLRAESQFAEVKVKMDRRNEGREVTHSAGQCMNPMEVPGGDLESRHGRCSCSCARAPQLSQQIQRSTTPDVSGACHMCLAEPVLGGCMVDCTVTAGPSSHHVSYVL
jgi:hypothetical protein